METPFIYKIVIIGDTNCGKSNIITRYTQNHFDENSHPTIGVEFYQKDIKIMNARKEIEEVRLQIWDTAGQERFRGMASSYYRKAAGILLVYDITNDTTFKNLRKWIDEIKSYGENQVDIVLLGNKKDLTEERKVAFEDGQKIAREQKIYFYETSAKKNEDQAIESVFYELAKKIHESERWRSDTQTEAKSQKNEEFKAPSLDLKEKNKKKEDKCC